MNSIFALGAFLLIGNAFALPEGRTVDQRPLKLGEFPYIVSIQTIQNRRHLCSGVLVSKQHVLTSKFCVERVSGINVQIQYGEIDLENYNWDKVIKIYQIHKHYDKNIALIQLYNNVAVSDEAQPAKLNKPNTSLPAGTNALLGAWKNRGKFQMDYTLYGVQTKVLSDTECTSVYGQKFIPRYEFCASSGATIADVRVGTYSDPLIVDGVVIGLVSYYDGRDTPAVYTKVSEHYNWIVSKMYN